jgi:hypothetical protein
VYSALLHGWRIMRNDGWATATVLVDLILLLTVALGWGIFSGVGVAGRWRHLDAGVLNLVRRGSRACARGWARAYARRPADDGVPGL